MKRLSQVLGLLLATTPAAFAQQDYGARFKSIPTWSADAAEARGAQDKYVFLVPQAGQMVIAYPENLGRADVQRNAGELRAGEMRIARFDLNNQVRASFSVDIRASGNALVYSYGITNAAGARQAISHIRLPIPAFGGSDSIVAPPGWSATQSASKVNAMRLATGREAGIFMTWYSQDWDASAIAPGADVKGFRITSTLKPGFTIAYLQGGRTAQLTEDMPPQVLEQTVPVLQIENNSQNLPTIAPKFSADAPASEIVADFQRGIARMIEQGQLDVNSPAVREALQALRSYEGKGPLTLIATPKPGTEADVLNAMNLSLQRR